MVIAVVLQTAVDDCAVAGAVLSPSVAALASTVTTTSEPPEGVTIKE